ncbi:MULTISPECIES: FecR domain-containing protein [unclassified Novosphingobium]|uniref:FecR family protein n=1 Tax=unclassified Novosphingobium TaxID=2644732 RepID=UPI000D302A71|nr:MULTISPECIES: FecR domain-containing protein [unclassified Novosphingobium]PTR13133.1 FecR family protein [Novosphingobium sp. GV055]PUB07352.1 FecR family protein [Novosphingobium sp. GV061]PUB23165.1 FecR family protein [Novosphingobium sp. GV079]PUB44929.1 FecR family protein [Novosphingobium sp. GV027]
MTAPNLHDSPILAEAARWMERARNGSEEDRQAFRAWLRERPEHVAAMDLVERAWREAPRAAAGRGLRPRARLAEPAAARGAGRWRVAGPLLGAACAALAAVAAWTLTVHEQYLAAPADRMASFALADGSRVWLTPGSAVTMRATLLGRSVALDGEGTFDVKHERRPFAVTAGDVRVVDRGTLFSVARRAGQTAVILARGAIDIEDSHSGALIATPHPGQQVSLAGDTATIAAIDADAALAWRDGRLVAQDLPLAAVMARFSQLSGVPIELRDPAMGDLRVYGTYRLGDVAQFLDAVGALYPVAWRRTERGYEVFRR